MNRESMKTVGGMSVRAEIEMRLRDARSAGIEEAIAFLNGSGHFAAAQDLQRAAFGEAEGQPIAGSAS